MENIKSKHEECLKHHADNFQSKVKKFRDVAKERHILFFEEVNKVQEFVNLKVESLNSEPSKEVAKLEQGHMSLHTKLDVVFEAN